MGDYQGHAGINRSADEAFDFLADIANMPRYMPTVRSVEPLGGNRLLIRGEAHGHPYQAEGWLDIEPDQRRMRWGSDDAADYRGELRVTGKDRAEVELRLHLVPQPDAARRMAEHEGGVEGELHRAVERTLHAIRQAIETSPRQSAEPSSTLYGRSATMNPDIT